jgi:5-methylcytosine-specific restriction endonuclease McrA
LSFHPYSKSEQLKGHQKKDKDTPKFKTKKPKKKNKKQEVYKGRTIPTRKQRATISKKEYRRTVEAFGNLCVYCGNPQIEIHHIKFRSQGGKGGYRNLIPLCKQHHNQAHSDRDFADRIRNRRELMFGEWYWADKWDLFKRVLIPNSTDEAFETFLLNFENNNPIIHDSQN